jgi:hypothetical protein
MIGCRRGLVVLIMVLSASTAMAQGQVAEAEVTPINPDLALALQKIRFDPKPPALIRDVHYTTSNEKHVRLFQDIAVDRGGIQLGVGAEQNYLLAGWSRPELVICMDFDQYITDVHTIYGLLFAEAKTAPELIKWWSAESQPKFVTLLEQAVGDTKQRKILTKIHRREGASIARHLGRQTAGFKKRGVATWLTQQEQFDFVRELWAKGRVIPLRGDLTGPNTLKDIGAVATRFELHVRLFYLSNAEYYFEYWDGSFRENVAALPFDQRSVVLHTHPTKKDYKYYHHTGENFSEWATHKKVKWFRTVKRHAEKTGNELLFTILKVPADVLKPKKPRKNK